MCAVAISPNYIVSGSYDNRLGLYGYKGRFI